MQDGKARVGCCIAAVARLDVVEIEGCVWTFSDIGGIARGLEAEAELSRT